MLLSKLYEKRYQVTAGVLFFLCLMAFSWEDAKRYREQFEKEETEKQLQYQLKYLSCEATNAILQHTKEAVFKQRYDSSLQEICLSDEEKLSPELVKQFRPLTFIEEPDAESWFSLDWKYIVFFVAIFIILLALGLLSYQRNRQIHNNNPDIPENVALQQFA